MATGSHATGLILEDLLIGLEVGEVSVVVGEAEQVQMIDVLPATNMDTLRGIAEGLARDGHALDPEGGLAAPVVLVLGPVPAPVPARGPGPAVVTRGRGLDPRTASAAPAGTANLAPGRGIRNGTSQAAPNLDRAPGTENLGPKKGSRGLALKIGNLALGLKTGNLALVLKTGNLALAQKTGSHVPDPKTGNLALGGASLGPGNALNLRRVATKQLLQGLLTPGPGLRVQTVAVMQTITNHNNSSNDPDPEALSDDSTE